MSIMLSHWQTEEPTGQTTSNYYAGSAIKRKATRMTFNGPMSMVCYLYNSYRFARATNDDVTNGGEAFIAVTGDLSIV